MKFWHNPNGFSIKDAIGILFGLLFTGLAIFAVVAGDPLRVSTAVDIIKTISPIIITIVGGYVVTEGTRGVMDTYYNRNDKQQGNTGDNEMKPPTSGGQI